MMATFDNRESLASVRTKINAAISFVDSFARDPASLDPFPTVLTLTADTTLTYTAGQAKSVATGDIINAGGFRYEVAASGASDHHVTTAGGVKLYVLPGADGVKNALAFGLAATGDNTPIIVKVLNSGGDVVVPDGTWPVSTAGAVNDNGPQKLIFTRGAVIQTSFSAGVDWLTFSGPTSVVGATIDFNSGNCRYALRWLNDVGAFEAKNITLKNLLDINSTDHSLLIYIDGRNSPFLVENIRGENIRKRGNGTITDTAGALNMIRIGSYNGSVVGTVRTVRVDELHNVNSSNAIIYEDCDTLMVATGINGADLNNNILIEDVQGYNFGKRLIKVQGSNVRCVNIHGISDEGDTTALVSFQEGVSIGDKPGCSLIGASAVGLFEEAIQLGQNGVYARDIYCEVQPGNKSGMANYGIGCWIKSNDVTLENYRSKSNRDISIGSASQVVKRLRLLNITLDIHADRSLTYAAIGQRSDTIGFDDLTIQNLTVKLLAGAPLVFPVDFDTFMNGTTIVGKNLTVRGCRFENDSTTLGQRGIRAQHIADVTVDDVKYTNRDSAFLNSVLSLEDCTLVLQTDVRAEGNATAVTVLTSCTTR